MSARPERLRTGEANGPVRPVFREVCMTTTTERPSFAVVSGRQVVDVLDGRHREMTELVAATYRAHGEALTINPPSYFLRFPDRPSSRIIALPASVGGEVGVDGLKWISSFPENIDSGLPRASAVLILNDRETGYPFACLEASVISATRTAASAALAAEVLAGPRRPRSIAVIGAGLIARYTCDFLTGTGWEFDRAEVFDLDPRHSAALGEHLRSRGTAAEVTVRDTAADAIGRADLVVFATVAGAPHQHDPAVFAHNPLVLNISLRDLSPEVVLASHNIVDDVEHCLKADTSVHLTEQRTGSRDFLAGTLFDVMAGTVSLPHDRPTIFSPFGLGVLDLAVGKYVYDELAARGELHSVDGFFHELSRHSAG